MGLDLHKKMIRYSLLDAAGDETANEKIPADAASLPRLIDRLTRDGTPLQVALEAGGCLVWVYDLLSKKL